MMPLILDKQLTLVQALGQASEENWVPPNGSPIECISAVIHEERNGEYFADLVVPIAATNFSEVELNRLVMMTTPNRDRQCSMRYVNKVQCFRIASITKMTNGLVNVHCNHITYDLLYKSGPTGTFGSPSSLGALQGIVQWREGDTENNFRGDANWVVTGTFSTQYMMLGSIRSFLGGQEGSLMDVYHTENRGEYEWSNLTVAWWDRRGADRGVQIVYGGNLTNFTLEEKLSFDWNAAIGYAIYDRVDEYSQRRLFTKQATDIYKASALLTDVRVTYVDFSDKFTEDDYNSSGMLDEAIARLESMTATYVIENLTSSSDIDFNLSLSFADLKSLGLQGDNIYLCDTIRIIYPKYNFDAKAKVIAYDYDVLREQYISIELGKPKQMFDTTITNNASKKAVKKIQGIYK